MTRFLLPRETVQALTVQITRNGTFIHSCAATSYDRSLSFTLQVDRGGNSTTFTVEMGTEKHSVSMLNRSPGKHWRLVEFIESIANGPSDSSETEACHIADTVVRVDQVVAAWEESLRNLVRHGGSLNVEWSTCQTVHIAVHRTTSRPGITAILTMGSPVPYTRCFTVHGDDERIYTALVNSIEHHTAAMSIALQAA